MPLPNFRWPSGPDGLQPALNMEVLSVLNENIREAKEAKTRRSRDIDELITGRDVWESNGAILAKTGCLPGNQSAA